MLKTAEKRSEKRSITVQKVEEVRKRSENSQKTEHCRSLFDAKQLIHNKSRSIAVHRIGQLKNGALPFTFVYLPHNQ